MTKDQFYGGQRIRTRYRIEGSGPDLVLIHGVSDRLESWDGIVERLEDRYRLIRYDLRGHGETDKPVGPYSLDDFADDLAELTTYLRLERFHLAGYSLGGLIAQRFSLRNMFRIDHLVLLSTVAGRNEVEKARVEERLRAVEQGDLDTHFEKSIARWFTDDFIRRNPDLVKRYSAQNSGGDQAGVRAAYRVLCTSDLIDELPKLKVPTLIVTGEHDIGSNPRMANNMHKAIAGSRMTILPHLKHSILIEAPETFAGLVADFLADNASHRSEEERVATTLRP